MPGTDGQLHVPRDLFAPVKDVQYVVGDMAAIYPILACSVTEALPLLARVGVSCRPTVPSILRLLRQCRKQSTTRQRRKYSVRNYFAVLRFLRDKVLGRASAEEKGQVVTALKTEQLLWIPYQMPHSPDESGFGRFLRAAEIAWEDSSGVCHKYGHISMSDLCSLVHPEDSVQMETWKQWLLDLGVQREHSASMQVMVMKAVCSKSCTKEAVVDYWHLLASAAKDGEMEEAVRNALSEGSILVPSASQSWVHLSPTVFEDDWRAVSLMLEGSHLKLLSPSPRLLSEDAAVRDHAAGMHFLRESGLKTISESVECLVEKAVECAPSNHVRHIARIVQASMGGIQRCVRHMFPTRYKKLTSENFCEVFPWHVLGNHRQ